MYSNIVYFYICLSLKACDIHGCKFLNILIEYDNRFWIKIYLDYIFIKLKYTYFSRTFIVSIFCCRV